MTSETDNLSFKVILLGDAAVGKTSIRRRYMGKGFVSSHLMTLGADFSQKKIELADGTKIRLQIWDIAGQEYFVKIRQRFLMNTDGLLLIFDITRKDTFDNLTHWLKQIWAVNDKKDIPILIIGNKSDLVETRKVSQEMVVEYMKSLRKDHNITTYLGYLETSAKTGENIENGFNKISKAMMILLKT